MLSTKEIQNMEHVHLLFIVYLKSQDNFGQDSVRGVCVCKYTVYKYKNVCKCINTLSVLYSWNHLEQASLSVHMLYTVLP